MVAVQGIASRLTERGASRANRRNATNVIKAVFCVTLDYFRNAYLSV